MGRRSGDFAFGGYYFPPLNNQQLRAHQRLDGTTPSTRSMTETSWNLSFVQGEPIIEKKRKKKRKQQKTLVAGINYGAMASVQAMLKKQKADRRQKRLNRIMEQNCKATGAAKKKSAPVPPKKAPAARSPVPQVKPRPKPRQSTSSFKKSPPHLRERQ